MSQTILVLHNEAAVFEVTQEELVKAGYNVVEKNIHDVNQEAVMKSIEASKPDLIVLAAFFGGDLYLRILSSLSKIAPVIVWSAYSLDWMEANVRSHGATKAVSKSLGIDGLVRAIGEILESR